MWVLILKISIGDYLAGPSLPNYTKCPSRVLSASWIEAVSRKLVYTSSPLCTHSYDVSPPTGISVATQLTFLQFVPLVALIMENVFVYTCIHT